MNQFISRGELCNCEWRIIRVKSLSQYRLDITEQYYRPLEIASSGYEGLYKPPSQFGITKI